MARDLLSRVNPRVALALIFGGSLTWKLFTWGGALVKGGV